MNKNRKLLLAALLLIAFAAVKLVLLQWWQAQQPQAVAAQCDLTEGCTLPDGSRVRAAAVSTKKPV
ncbi:secreted protein [Neisseria meningitidis]|nr:secreted protein [Neisseria meningitidis]